MTATPEAGSAAPDFTLATDGGGSFTLSLQKGRPVVVYFYPKDDTSGCTKEAIDFTGQASAFREAGATVVGISRDDAASHDKFKAKHGLDLILAADTDGSVCEAWGVWVEKSMYGRKYMGIERATYLVGPDGTIRRVWRKVKVPGHVEEVLSAVRDL